MAVKVVYVLIFQTAIQPAHISSSKKKNPCKPNNVSAIIIISRSSIQFLFVRFAIKTNEQKKKESTPKLAFPKISLNFRLNLEMIKIQKFKWITRERKEAKYVKHLTNANKKKCLSFWLRRSFNITFLFRTVIWKLIYLNLLLTSSNEKKKNDHKMCKFFIIHEFYRRHKRRKTKPYNCTFKKKCLNY